MKTIKNIPKCPVCGQSNVAVENVNERGWRVFRCQDCGSHSSKFNNEKLYKAALIKPWISSNVGKKILSRTEEEDAFRKQCEENNNYIKDNLSRRELLEGLAEEAAELSQAALKVIRAEKLNGNPTPLKAFDARENLAEEISDVMTMAYMLDILPAVFWPDPEKMERWVKRVKKIKGDK
ncbi:MAG: hypothetical protein ACI3XH_04770 [Phascolarctobacterium sp.]